MVYRAHCRALEIAFFRPSRTALSIRPHVTIELEFIVVPLALVRVIIVIVRHRRLAGVSVSLAGVACRPAGREIQRHRIPDKASELHSRLQRRRLPDTSSTERNPERLQFQSDLAPRPMPPLGFRRSMPCELASCCLVSSRGFGFQRDMPSASVSMQ